MVDTDFRADKTPFVVQIPTHARIQHHAVDRLFAVVLKTGELAEHIKLEITGILFPICGKARHDGIRLVFITVGVGERLIVLHGGVAGQLAAE